MRAADYATPFVGWRVWRVAAVRDGVRLLSAVYDEVWEPRVAIAARCCAAGQRGHRSPGQTCACGIYAATALAACVRYLVGRDDPSTVHRVVGQVSLWGDVVAGPAGWRASAAYPARLWVPAARTNGGDAPVADVALDLLAYGVPVGLLDAYEPRAIVRELARSTALAA